MTLDNGVHVPRPAVVAIGAALMLLGAGATGGVQAWTLRAQVARVDSTLTDHLRWSLARSEVLTTVGEKLVHVDQKLDALTRLKCLEARDVGNHALREQAYDRLAISQIDCGDLLGNKVPRR